MTEVEDPYIQNYKTMVVLQKRKEEEENLPQRPVYQDMCVFYNFFIEKVGGLGQKFSST